MSSSTTVFNQEQESLPKWQRDLTNQILNTMSDFYCLPDKFDRKKEELKNQLINKFKEINKSLLKDEANIPPSTEEKYKNFVSQINRVLNNFDTHLGLEYNPQAIQEMKTNIDKGKNSAKFNAGSGPPRDVIEGWNKFEEENPSTRNFGFVDYQGPSGIIPNNIGYVNISHLIDPQNGANEIENKYRLGPNAIKRLQEVMAGFQDKEGIVLDLSVTPYGGSPEMVQNILSYFIPEGTHYNTIRDRMSDEEIPYESTNTPFKLLDKPVVILIGPKTFSGREEIAYDLQQYNTTLDQDRFTLIGERTKGGAHPECSFPLIDIPTETVNANLVIRVPYATAINPISKTNWEDGPLQEGKKPGIQPDIEPPTIKNVLNFGLNHLQSMILLRKTPESDISVEQMANSAFGMSSNTAKEKRGKIWGSNPEQKNPAPVAQSDIQQNESQKNKPDSTTEYQSPSPFSGAKGMKPDGFK
jgi:hypothetical protein